MKTIEYRTVDKSSWPIGVWQEEPDKRQWMDEASGLPCLIVRNPSLGHLCGYVGVPPHHPDFCKEYDNVSADVHGGLTFSGFCQKDSEETGICHTVEVFEDDKVYWFGFDCAHWGDMSPNMPFRDSHEDGQKYKDFPYVEKQCQELAAQLKERMTSGEPV